MTDKSKGNHGISAFIVEELPRLLHRQAREEDGHARLFHLRLIFEDCIVPKENLLGKEGKGFKIAMQTLDGGRIGIAAQALGLGEGAWTRLKYTRSAFSSEASSQFQNTQFQLADMHCRMQAAQYLV